MGKSKASPAAGSCCSCTNALLLSTLVAGLAIGWNIINKAPHTQVVQTTSGPIRGEELIFEGFHYKAFKGISYAAPPIGHLRFKGPQPPQKWTDVRDTISYGSICHQPNGMANMPPIDLMKIIPVMIKAAPMIISQIMRLRSSSEDCLTLNVFTQSLDKKDPKPVLVWIHGGGFFGGDGTDSVGGPQYLIQHDIVFVSIQYRVGPLGFLSTGTPDATGNYGMKDQVAALRWVQENIAEFGGDPKQVTLFGSSAGGASAHLHMFSPLSKGLFHKVIAGSGSAMNHWAVFSNQTKYNKNLARLLGAAESEIEDPAKRVQFLRDADSKTMSNIMFDTMQEEAAENPFMDPLPFAPVIEPPGTKDAFLTEHPKTLLRQGRFTKVPLMIGSTDLEGTVLFMGIGKNESVQNVSRGIAEVEKNFSLMVPEVLKKGISAQGDCSKVAQLVRNVYFEGKSFQSSLLNFLQLYGDMLMVSEIHQAQREHAKHATKNAPVYSYYFTFNGEWNIFADLLLPPDIKGAGHSEDILYVFALQHLGLSSVPPSSPDVITRERMLSFFTNFVKYGHPTPSVSDLVPVKWEPAKPKESNVMIIGEDLKMEKQLLKSRMDMWDQLHKTYTGSPLFS